MLEIFAEIVVSIGVVYFFGSFVRIHSQRMTKSIEKKTPPQFWRTMASVLLLAGRRAVVREQEKFGEPFNLDWGKQGYGSHPLQSINTQSTITSMSVQPTMLHMHLGILPDFNNSLINFGPSYLDSISDPWSPGRTLRDTLETVKRTGRYDGFDNQESVALNTTDNAKAMRKIVFTENARLRTQISNVNRVRMLKKTSNSYVIELIRTKK